MSASVGIVGVGSMGGAILRGAVDAGVVDARAVVVLDRDEANLHAARALGCRAATGPGDLDDVDHLLLAVKPQQFPGAAEALGERSRPTVVITVMAGVSSGRIRDALGPKARVVRAMPNTPCRVGAGVTAVARGAGAEPGDDDFARAVFGAIGEVVRVDEADLHAVTAVSGSGPAYVFLLAEEMERAGVELGLEPAVARRLAYRTVEGAGRLLLEEAREADASAQRRRVTSPGGTTEAALRTLAEGGWEALTRRAIRAAKQRAEELAG